MSNCSVRFPSSVHELAPMIHSERLELEDSCLGVLPPDKSSPPRRCAVWLGIVGSAVHAGLSYGFLDAFAHVASTRLNRQEGDTACMARVVWMSIAAGADADWVLKSLAKESTSQEQFNAVRDNSKVMMAVRWCYDANNLTQRKGRLQQ